MINEILSSFGALFKNKPNSGKKLCLGCTEIKSEKVFTGIYISYTDMPELEPVELCRDCYVLEIQLQAMRPLMYIAIESYKEEK